VLASKKGCGSEAILGDLERGEKKGKIVTRVKEVKFVVAEKASTRLTDKSTKIMDKAQALKTKAFHKSCTNTDPFSVLEYVNANYFINVAKSCGIMLGDNENTEIEVIKKIEAQEKAYRLRKEWELQIEKEKQKLLIPIEGLSMDTNEEREGDPMTSSEEDLEGVNRKPRKIVHKRRQARSTTKIK
jgi:hypothetical protein